MHFLDIFLGFWSLKKWREYFRLGPKMQNIWRIFEHFSKIQNTLQLAIWKPVCTKYSLKEKCHTGPKTQGSSIFTIKRKVFILIFDQNALFWIFTLKLKISNFKNHQIFKPCWLIRRWDLKNWCQGLALHWIWYTGNCPNNQSSFNISKEWSQFLTSQWTYQFFNLLAIILGTFFLEKSFIF